MNLKNVLRRIELYRKARSNNLLAIDDFCDKVCPATEFLRFIEGMKAKKEIKLEARKHFVISCVSGMELYFKKIIIVFVNSGWVHERFLTYIKQDKVTLADIYEIEKNRISLGEIISVTYSFQNLDSINRIMSEMFGIRDFISEIKNYRLNIEEDDEDSLNIVLQEDYPDFYKKISELVELRNIIVHHMGPRRLGLNRVSEMYDNLCAFMTVADDYILGKIPIEE